MNRATDVTVNDVTTHLSQLFCMYKLQYSGSIYHTPAQSLSFTARLFPSLYFYFDLVAIVIRAGNKAKAGRYSDANWVESSRDVLRRLEQAGVRVSIEGIDNVLAQEGPVVFIGNHMSMMETLVLPVIIQPVKPVTFVIKEDLLAYPVFQHVMRSRNPIAVSRTNPRQDLKVVLTEGQDRLQKGVSVIVFPQTTRSQSFSPEQMSSIGVKLAKKAEVPVIPLALKTDCWQNGRWVKDLGKLDIAKAAHYAFGRPIKKILGKGDDEQAVINAFIAEQLRKWGGETQNGGRKLT